MFYYFTFIELCVEICIEFIWKNN